MSNGLINRQYVGARYVPKIMGEWNKALQYEALSVVTYMGNSFTSKIPVPSNIDISNNKYWVNTGNYNVQLDNINKKLNSMNFYNVTDYGILPNMGNVYPQLFEFFKTVVRGKGGIVYFPSGTYTVDFSVVIPNNTTIIGEGKNTVILFNEANRELGTAFYSCNENITIENITINTKTKGIFHSGPQNGSIGFTNLDEKYYNNNAYSSTLYPADHATNLTARNIYCDTNYCIQTEPLSDVEFNNITYENIYAPNGCVSITPKGDTGVGTLNNIKINNINCDLLRIGFSSGKIDNAVISNCNTGRIYYDNTRNNNVIFDNIKQKTNARNDDSFDTKFISRFNGECILNNCIINGNENETNGIYIGEGIVTLNNCKITAENKLFNLGKPTDNGGYLICYNNKFNVNNPKDISVVIGYGKNNEINSNYINYIIWGDMYKEFTNIGKNSPSSYYHNKLTINSDNINLHGLFSITTNSDIFTLTEKLQNLPFLSNTEYEAICWNSITGKLATLEVTYGTFENGTFKITDPSYSGNHVANACSINANLSLQRKPTISELIKIFL